MRIKNNCTPTCALRPGYERQFGSFDGSGPSCRASDQTCPFSFWASACVAALPCTPCTSCRLHLAVCGRTRTFWWLTRCLAFLAEMEWKRETNKHRKRLEDVILTLNQAAFSERTWSNTYLSCWFFNIGGTDGCYTVNSGGYQQELLGGRTTKTTLKQPSKPSWIPHIIEAEPSQNEDNRIVH